MGDNIFLTCFKLLIMIYKKIYMALAIVTLSLTSLVASAADCRCGLIWGDGCSAANHGNVCWTGTYCSDGASNCE